VQTERAKQEQEKFLHCFVSTQASNWSKFLIWTEHAHNTLLNLHARVVSESWQGAVWISLLFSLTFLKTDP
jgi:hypothetical protein